MNTVYLHGSKLSSEYNSERRTNTSSDFTTDGDDHFCCKQQYSHDLFFLRHFLEFPNSNVTLVHSIVTATQEQLFQPLAFNKKI